VQLLGKEAHRAGKAVAAKPAQDLLRAMRKEDHPQKEPEQQGFDTVVGS
jgi:hypothetical protein